MQRWMPLLLSSALLFGSEGPDFDPWFTGPFLAPTPSNPEMGHPELELGILNNYVYGNYNDDWEVVRNELLEWTLSPFIDFQFALTDRIGIEVFTTYSNRFKGDESFHHLTDTLFNVGFQILTDEKDSWQPNFRLIFSTTFPTGKFDELDVPQRGIDAQGLGAYFFGPVFSFQKLFYLPRSYFSLQWSFAVRWPTTAKLEGISSFGGDKNTIGRIKPGEIYTAFLSFEWGFAKHWAFAMDTSFFHQSEASKFRGTTTIPVAQPTQTQVSLTPSIEYNFSSKTGILLGSWFTIAGRNTDAFAALFLAWLHTF